MTEFNAITSMWDSIAAWFTPTILFGVANLIVATIFIASKKHHDNVGGNSNSNSNSFSRFAKVSSFLDRARSLDLRSYTTAESPPESPSESRSSVYGSSSRLAQSIHLTSGSSELSSGDEMSPSESKRHAPSLFERIKSIKFSSDYNDSEFPVDSDEVSNASSQLERAPSFLDRVKSFKISSPFRSGPGNVDTDPSQNPDHQVTKSKPKKTSEKKTLPEMKKSRSEMRMTPDEEEDVDLRRPATARAGERRIDFEEEVDTKADDFINRFKKQLKLQRIESLVRYNEMMNRGR